MAQVAGSELIVYVCNRRLNFAPRLSSNLLAARQILTSR